MDTDKIDTTDGGHEKFKQEVHRVLLERLQLRRKDAMTLSESALREKAHNAILEVLAELRWQVPRGASKDAIIKEVLDEALGLGPLEELLADESVSEIMVNSFNQIYAERKGVLELTDRAFSSERAVLNAIERIIAPIGRRIDESSPLVDARLRDGSRVNAAIRPVALDGPCITIRKFSKSPVTADKLVQYGSLSRGMADFIKIAVADRMNIVVSGGTGSGKTTLLNVLSSFIPQKQRVITIEDAAELQLPDRHVVRFESRPPNIEGTGQIDIATLVKNALRMRPDRIIVGECRGGETLAMLQAMNTGHAGSMTTGHANTPVDMLSRIETMVLMAGVDLPVRAIRQQIASAVNFIVQQTRFSCGTRRVTSITEITGFDPEECAITTEEVFRFNDHGYGPDGKIRGVHQATGYIPAFVRKLQQDGQKIDGSLFSPGK
jgi:pilus assembly protein CpaF